MKNLIFDTNIWPLSLSTFISKTGDFAYEVGFAIIAIELLAFDYFYLGVVYFFRFIPYLLFGPVGGWLADNSPRKFNMFASDVLRFVVAIIVYLVYESGNLNIYILALCSMIMTIGRSLYQPSFRAYLPTVLEKKDLPTGNSFFQVVEDVASILGPLACSLIISISEKGYVILMYAISYFMSAFILLFLREYTKTDRSRFVFSMVFRDAKKIIINARIQNQSLFMVVMGTSICVLFTASLLRFVLPGSIISVHGDEALVGYIFSVMSIGTVVGGMCYTLLVKNSTPVQLMNSWVTYGLLFLAVSVAVKFNVASVFVVIFFLGFSGAIVDISIITNIQFLSAQGDVGKNYGIYSTLANTCEAASGLVSGIFSILVGGASFTIMSLLIAVSAKAVVSKMKRI
jgi:DHA3 family macrolide efflux protein-like MFS transporter